MLNSSSNNPGFGNVNGLKAKLGAQNNASVQDDNSEPIIQEVYEAEPDDYNFVPQLREVDEAEIRNLSAIRPETSVDRRVYMASAAFLICALIGAGIGFGIASHSASRADIQRKSSIARTIKNTMSAKLDGLKALKADFDGIAGSNYNEANFDNFRTKVRTNTYPFMMDMSSEVTAESVLLIGNSQANPLKGLREYSAKTMLLRQLLETHGVETRVESEAISELQSQGGKSKVTYAMQVIPDALYYLATDAPRSQYANGAIGIYTYRNVIDSDQKLTDVYSQMKIDKHWSEMQRMRRDYQPTDKKEAARIESESLDLPNHLIYDTVDRQGNTNYLFADELILVDRSLFFGESANAKERYEWRNANIKALIDDIASSSSSIVGELDKFIVSE